MGNGEDWLWRPVLAGLCQAESILNSTLDLGDVALLNELLDIREYNQSLTESKPRG